MKQASCPSQWLILHHGPDLVVWVSLFVYCLVEPDIHLFVYILFTYIIAVIHIWLVGGFKHFLFSIIYGMSSFPLTSIFFKMGTLHHQPGWLYESQWLTPMVRMLCIYDAFWQQAYRYLKSSKVLSQSQWFHQNPDITHCLVMDHPFWYQPVLISGEIN